MSSPLNMAEDRPRTKLTTVMFCVLMTLEASQGLSFHLSDSLRDMIRALRSTLFVLHPSRYHSTTSTEVTTLWDLSKPFFGTPPARIISVTEKWHLNAGKNLSTFHQFLAQHVWCAHTLSGNQCRDIPRKRRRSLSNFKSVRVLLL